MKKKESQHVSLGTHFARLANETEDGDEDKHFGILLELLETHPEERVNDVLKLVCLLRAYAELKKNGCSKALLDMLRREGLDLATAELKREIIPSRFRINGSSYTNWGLFVESVIDGFLKGAARSGETRLAHTAASMLLERRRIREERIISPRRLGQGPKEW